MPSFVTYGTPLLDQSGHSASISKHLTFRINGARKPRRHSLPYMRALRSPPRNAGLPIRENALRFIELTE